MAPATQSLSCRRYYLWVQSKRRVQIAFERSYAADPVNPEGAKHFSTGVAVVKFDQDSHAPDFRFSLPNFGNFKMKKRAVEFESYEIFCVILLVYLSSFLFQSILILISNFKNKRRQKERLVLGDLSALTFIQIWKYNSTSSCVVQCDGFISKKSFGISPPFSPFHLRREKKQFFTARL